MVVTNFVVDPGDTLWNTLIWWVLQNEDNLHAVYGWDGKNNISNSENIRINRSD